MSQGQTNALALCGVKDKPNDVTNALQRMEQEGYPVIAPGGTTMCPTLPAGYSVGVTAIRFSKDDTYKMDGALCLKASALNRLARGLGIQWKPETFRRMDDQKDPYYCSMVVAGEYRDYTGELVTITGTRAVDLRDGSPEYEAMRNRNTGELNLGQIARARANIQQICETKAKNRAIADACVSRSISPSDLNREFVMAKVYKTAPDMVAAAEANSALYGGETMDPETGEIRNAEAEVRDAEPPPQTETFEQRCASMSLDQLEQLRARAQQAIDAGAAEDADGETLDRARKASLAMDTIVEAMERKQPMDGVPF